MSLSVRKHTDRTDTDTRGVSLFKVLADTGVSVLSPVVTGLGSTDDVKDRSACQSAATATCGENLRWIFARRLIRRGNHERKAGV